jgi:hypothetical protein
LLLFRYGTLNVDNLRQNNAQINFVALPKTRQISNPEFAECMANGSSDIPMQYWPNTAHPDWKILSG